MGTFRKADSDKRIFHGNRTIKTVLSVHSRNGTISAVYRFAFCMVFPFFWGTCYNGFIFLDTLREIWENEMVSIIIPAYNAEKYIEQTAASVLAQTWEDWELLIVENGSTDRTREIVTKMTDARIRMVVPEKQRSAAMARNTGLAEAKGRYIAFLDADDLWKSDKLAKELEFMRQKDAGFVFTAYEYADENGVGKGKIAHVPESLTYREALKNTIIFTSTVLFDTHKIPKQLLYMPEVKSEDTATWWNILRHGHTAYGLDKVLVLYRRPAKSLSSNKLEAIRRVWNLYRRVERLGFFYSLYNFIYYAFRTVKRRL